MPISPFGNSPGTTLPGYTLVSFADSLTATGSSQATALPLIAELNRVTTVAAGTGVNLPPSFAGMVITIIHQGANVLSIFPAQGTSDSINGASGLLQFPGSVSSYYCTAPGVWVAQTGSGFYGSYATEPAADNLSGAGNNRATATAIQATLSRFTTVAASTGAVLPGAAAGLSFTVINAGANPLQVYAAGSDTINGTAGATGVALANGKTATYYSASTGSWHSIVSA